MRARSLSAALSLFVLGCGSSGDDGASIADDSGIPADSAITPGDSSAPSDSTPSLDSIASETTPSDSTPTDSTLDAGGTRRPFPDTTSILGMLADQLPPMNDAQVRFAATHFVGTEKELLDVTHALRAVNPKFLVLHYHLAMWQSAPTTQFILDGKSWGNDYPTVTTHEDWFWHDASGTKRVASTADGKLLMNVSNVAFQKYWADSLAAQVAAGEYDGVFLDSASPALLQGECARDDARLAGTAAKDTPFVELGGKSFIKAWESWIAALDAALSAKGIALIPNTSAFVTGWDNTNYGLSAGIFAEGFADPSFSTSDWKSSTNELLSLSRANKIMILQNYLGAATDVAKRLYYFGNYLLVKGQHTYLDYFASTPLEWYPEWGLDLGAPTAAVSTNVDALSSSGVYRRDFAKGSVLVNPTAAAVTVPLTGAMKRVVPSGGGAVDASGTAPGTIATTDVTSISVAAHGAEVLLK